MPTNGKTESYSIPRRQFIKFIGTFESKFHLDWKIVWHQIDPIWFLFGFVINFQPIQRMHPVEYERYSSLRSINSPQTDLDIQQSVVSTIKSNIWKENVFSVANYFLVNIFFSLLGEDLEFVDVHQDDLAGETWDSFESSDFYENLDNQQAESAATSTTKTVLLQTGDGKSGTISHHFEDSSSRIETNFWQ